MPTLSELQAMTARAEEIAHHLDELRDAGDNLQRAMVSCRDWNTNAEYLSEKLLKEVISHGINSVRASLIGELKEMGVEAE